MWFDKSVCILAVTGISSDFTRATETGGGFTRKTESHKTVAEVKAAESLDGGVQGLARTGESQQVLERVSAPYRNVLTSPRRKEMGLLTYNCVLQERERLAPSESLSARLTQGCLPIGMAGLHCAHYLWSAYLQLLRQ